MPGTNLNLDLPSLSDTMSTIVTKLVAALAAVQTDLTPKITPAVMNMNAPLSMGGNAINNITALQLAAGNTPSTPGSIYYSGGEFYGIDQAGIVQITLNGVLNNAANGGILGDYGQIGVNAQVYYDAASTQFRFTSDTSVWADLVARSLLLEGTNGTVQLKVDNAINTARVVSVKSLPAAGVSLLVYNGATSTIEDAAVTSPTNAIPTMTVGTLTTTADPKHTDTWSRTIPLVPAQVTTSLSAAALSLTSIGTPWAYTGPVMTALRTGDQIFSIGGYILASPGASNVVIKLKKQLNGVISTIDTWTQSTGATGLFSHNIAVPASVAVNEQWFLDFSAGSGFGVIISEMHAFYTHP